MKLVVIVFCSIILFAASEPKTKDAAATKPDANVSPTTKLEAKVPDVLSEQSGNGYLVYGSGSKGGRKGQYESQMGDYGKEYGKEYGYNKGSGGRNKGKYSSSVGDYGYEDYSKGYGGRNYKGEYQEPYLGGYGYEENSKDSERYKDTYGSSIYGDYGYESNSKNSDGRYKDEYPYQEGYGYEDNSKGYRGGYGYGYGYDKNYKGVGEKGKGDYGIEELLYGYGGGQYNYGGKNPDYKYRIYGRQGLGFDKRTAYALGLRYPLTPKLLETVYRNTKYDDCYSCDQGRI